MVHRGCEGADGCPWRVVVRRQDSRALLLLQFNKRGKFANFQCNTIIAQIDSFIFTSTLTLISLFIVSFPSGYLFTIFSLSPTLFTLCIHITAYVICFLDSLRFLRSFAPFFSFRRKTLSLCKLAPFFSLLSSVHFPHSVPSHSSLSSLFRSLSFFRRRQ